MDKKSFDFIKPGETRVRVAPSPTGYLHIGLARTALFNYLLAEKQKGSFILRIEDTDTERSSKEFEEDILENLSWIGINWTEGPDIGGKYGPYRQSERKHIYSKYLKKLLEENKAYYCFCTEEELEAQRQYQISIGEAPRYLGKCANLPKEEAEKNLSQKKPYVIRFRTPKKKVSFEDLIRGNIEFESSLIGDIVIAKDVNNPLYNFAVAVDDSEMKISHVIRGEDHIPNTPKQILIQEALGFKTPVYAHLPLILGPDKKKLSKRHATVSVSDYRKEGYLPEALINFMAFLGWNPGDEREIFSLPALIKEFSLEKIQKAGAIFNQNKLDFLNGFYLRQKSKEKLAELCVPFLEKAGLINEEKGTYSTKKGEISFERLAKIISLYQERIKKLSEIAELVDFFFKDPDYEPSLLKWKNEAEEEIKKSLASAGKTLSKIKETEWTKEKIEEIGLREAEKNIDSSGKKDRGKFLWPLRASLTGKKNSAGPFEIAEVLGKEETLKRIEKAKNSL